MRLAISPRVLTTACAIAFGAAAASHAQSVLPAGPVDLSAVRKDLRNLVVAQEVYFTNHDSYAAGVASLDFTPSDGVTIKLVETGAQAYSASGSLAGKSGVSCVVFVGGVSAIPKTAQGIAAKTEGGPACDGDPPAERTKKHP